MKTEPVIKEVLLNVPVSKVWKAITSKQDMSHWCFDLLTEFKPEVGFEFQFKGKGEKGQLFLHLCKVTEVIPNKKLSYSWRYKDYPGDSLVIFELFEEGEKTRLRLTHEGIESFGKDNPDLARESFDKGWSEILSKSLREYLEAGNK